MKDDRRDEAGNLLPDGVVGVKDGSVVAAIWDEKHYLDNKATIGSDNKVLFIGDVNYAKKYVKPNIIFNNSLSKYGVLYGFAGNKGMILVDSKKITKERELYESFISSYSEFISSLGTKYSKDQLVEREYHIEDYKDSRKDRIKKVFSAFLIPVNKIRSKNKKDANNNADSANQNTALKVSDNVANGLSVAGHAVRIAIPYFWPAEIIEIVGQGLIKHLSAKKIIDQQYRYGVFDLYINALERFME